MGIVWVLSTWRDCLELAGENYRNVLVWRVGFRLRCSASGRCSVEYIILCIDLGSSRVQPAVRPIPRFIQGNFNKAEKLHERVESTLEKTHGPDHPVVAEALKLRADMLWQQVRAV